MVISYSVMGEDTASLDLLRFAERAADPAPALALIAELFRSQIGERFDREGPGWAPLKETTVASKQSQGLADKILQATGAGKASLTEHGGDNVEVITGDTLVFGSSLGYMAIHHKGAPAANIPQRKVVDFSAAQRAEHGKILQRFLVEGEATPSYRIAVGV